MGCAAQKKKKTEQPVATQLSASTQLRQSKEMRYSTHQVNTLLTKIHDLRRNSNQSVPASPARQQNQNQKRDQKDKENLSSQCSIQNEEDHNNSCAESNQSQKMNRRSPYKFSTQDTNHRLMQSGSFRKSLFQSINIKEIQANHQDDDN